MPKYLDSGVKWRISLYRKSVAVEKRCWRMSIYCRRLSSALQSSNTTETYKQTTRISTLWNFHTNTTFPRKRGTPGAKFQRTYHFAKRASTPNSKQMKTISPPEPYASSTNCLFQQYIHLDPWIWLTHVSSCRNLTKSTCHPNLVSRCQTHTEKQMPP